MRPSDSGRSPHRSFARRGRFSSGQSRRVSKPQFANHGHESRVRAKGIETRVDFERENLKAPVFERIAEPCQSLGWLAKAKVKQHELKRRNVALTRHGCQFMKNPQRGLAFSRQTQQTAQSSLHARTAGREANGPLESGSGFVEVLALFLNHTESEPGGREVRVQFDGVIALLQSLVKFTAITGDNNG